MHMLHSREMKKGFTMVELLVVVSIMGILSTMGIVSLHGAVVNNRVKDAAINVSAYLERVASETNRLSQKVCVYVEGQSIKAAKGECKSKGSTISKYTLEQGELKFDTGSSCSGEHGSNWGKKGVVFEPKFGLSAAPAEGCIIIKYGTKGEKQARALKRKSKNNIIPQMSFESGKSNSWIDL